MQPCPRHPWLWYLVAQFAIHKLHATASAPPASWNRDSLVDIVIASLMMIRFGNNRVAVRFLWIFPALFVAAFVLVASCVASDAWGRNLALTGLPPSDSPTITYRKIFKSSYPEFVEIKLNEGGHGTFDIRQLDEAANPQPFE